MRITKSIWDIFYRDQQSGHMNMYGHYLVSYFLEDGAYDKAYEHFEVLMCIEDLVIE